MTAINESSDGDPITGQRVKMTLQIVQGGENNVIHCDFA